jgi:hypothetical protein
MSCQCKTSSNAKTYHFTVDASRCRRTAGPWDSLPAGWDRSSLESFWGSLTGEVKHKVTKCIDRMTGKIDDPGAFCASLADKVEGKEWRSKKSHVASDVAREIMKVAKALVAISCPKGWEPSSTGQTCTDGKGTYRAPEDFGGEKVEKPGRMGDPEARSVLHNRLDSHFKGKPKKEDLSALLDKARKDVAKATPENKQKLRQIQESVITYGEKHGIKLSAVIDRVAAAFLPASDLPLQSRRGR